MKNGLFKVTKSLQKYPDGIFDSFMAIAVSHLFAAASYKMNLSLNINSFL